MIFNLKTTNIELTDALRDYAEKKFKALAKYFSKIIAMHVEVGKTTKHRRHGELFLAEVNINIPGNMLRTEQTSEDLYVAIDEAVAVMKMELKKAKEKKVENIRTKDE